MSQRPLLAIAIGIILVATGCNATASPTPTSAPTSGAQPSAAPAATSGTSAAPATAAPATSAAARQLDRIRVALNSNVNNFDNCKSQAAPDAQAMGLIAGFLFRWDKDGNPVPELAQSLDPSSDGLTWTLKLKPGMKYSDGTPVTADDVVYQFNRCKDAPGTYKVYIDSVTGVEATDATTVVYKMSSPKAIFPQFFPFWFAAIWPKGAVSANTDAFFKHPIGAGPYVLKSGTIGDPSFVLEENPTYVLGPRAAKTIELIAVPDLTSRALQLVQGQLDYVYNLPPSMNLVDTPDIQKWTHNAGALYRLNFNMGLPEGNPLRDRDVREAISLAIDRDQIVNKAFFKLNKPAQGDAPSFMGDLVLANYPNGGKRDLAAAKAKLAGTPFKDGFKFSIMTAGERPGYLDAVLIIQQNLKDLNITVTPDNSTIGVTFTKMDSGAYDANFGNHGGGGPLLSWWANAYTPTSFWGAKSKYDNPKMSDLLKQIGSATDLAATKDLWKQAQELSYNDPANGLTFISMTDDSGHLSGSRVSRDAIDAVLGRDPFFIGPAGAGQ
jgi:peptide/nickel transport system substrate-binding protein